MPSITWTIIQFEPHNPLALWYAICWYKSFCFQNTTLFAIYHHQNIAIALSSTTPLLVSSLSNAIKGIGNHPFHSYVMRWLGSEVAAITRKI